MFPRDLKRRPILKIPMGDNVFLYRVTVEGYKSNENDKDVQRGHFVSTLFSSQDILLCGVHGFDSLKIYYDENGWVAEAQAIVKEEV